MMRLDKYLAERTGMTRSESRKAVTKGRVSIAHWGRFWSTKAP